VHSQPTVCLLGLTLASLAAVFLLKTFLADTPVRAIGVLTASRLRAHLTAKCTLVNVYTRIQTTLTK